MTTIDTRWRAAIDGITRDVTELETVGVPADGWGDAAVLIRRLEIRLATIRQDIEKEAAEQHQLERERLAAVTAEDGLVGDLTPEDIQPEPEAHAGDVGRLIPKNSHTYTYNESRIFADVMDALGEGATFVQAIRVLQRGDALTLKWKVSKLRPILAAVGIKTVTASAAVTDDLEDPAHIGKTTTTVMVRENV